jgi:predicted glycogen debranching enzyme
MITLDVATLRNFERAAALEWIETNGVGGWASSTVCFANTRRYHGLLVAATERERRVLVSKLDESVAGVALAANRFPGAIHPRGFEHLAAFRKEIFPVWEYDVGGVRLRKTVVAPRGENTTIVLYEVLAAPAPFELRLAPFLAGRDYHALLRRGAEPPRVDAVIDVPGARFEPAADWWTNFLYDREEERGLDALEDLWTPGVHVVTLKEGDVLPVVLATERRDRDALAIIAAERARREALTTSGDDFVRDLTLAADQFIVGAWRTGTLACPPAPDRQECLSSTQTENTIIAGYHWFTDWGRDTMISLPGLCLATGRFDDAREILRRWARCASRGMIPNRFPDGTTEPAYNAVDATLWMFVAAWHYLQATGDRDFVLSVLAPVLREAIASFDRGTRFNIHVDADGLLYAGAGGVALTWMDAIVDGHVVTPRRGKPVEVNALWANALRIVAEICGDDVLASRAARVRDAFERAFWNEAAGCCFDVVGDPSIRPNQVIALSLPFPLFDDARAESMLKVIDAKLLTPVGLRTLSPDDPRYRPHLIGPQRERDEAYHQGTVWPWLLGPYIAAALRVRGERGRAAAAELLSNMRAHLGEAGLGTISECFDGDPPHRPRGCIAQAWSVAEVLWVSVIRSRADGEESPWAGDPSLRSG